MDIESKSVHDFKKFGFKLNPIFIGVMALIAQSTHAELLTNTPVQTNDSKLQQCEQHAKSPAEKLACKNSPHSPQLLADATPSKAVSPKLLIDADEAIRMAEVTDSSTSNAPNKVNTPNKTKDSKALNAKEGKDLPFELKTEKIQVRAKRFYEVGPLPGLGLTKEEIPGNVQSITAKEIKEAHSLSMTDLLNKKLQSVNVNDYQGNPFMMDVTYRGFTAGPQIGTPQGLSVFFDGIRVNEPFGDVVNWDMIPMNAIAGVDVFPGSNPIFGLNTLGGAFTLKTKDGFNNEGVDAEVLTGSFGRKQLQVEGGWNNGTVALFGAGNFFLEDGWRQNSPSKVNQFFGKGSYRGDKLDLNLSTLLVKTDLVGNGLLPSEMYAQKREGIYTGPDTTKNKLAQFQLSSSYFVNDNFTITGQVYRRDSKRHQVGADVQTQYKQDEFVRKIDPNATFSCLFNASNKYTDLPAYIVVPINVTQGGDLLTSAFFTDLNNAINNPSPTNADFFAANYSSNIDLDPGFLASMRYSYLAWSNPRLQQIVERQITVPPNTGTFDSTVNDYLYFADFNTTFQTFDSAGAGILVNLSNYFYTTQSNGGGGVDYIKNYIFPLAATNEAACVTATLSGLEVPNPAFGNDGGITNLPSLLVDGAIDNQPGWVQGTPTAVFNDNNINQTVDGASVQFNWNLEHHKFMVGASIDAAKAEYTNTSQLGFLDANRNAYLDPNQALPMFLGAYLPLSNNNFSGTNTTKSVYLSETWTPVETWHFNASARYNDTQAKNTIATRSGLAIDGIGDLLVLPDYYRLCPNGNCNGVPLNYAIPQLKTVLDPAETEKFSYHSLNPSLGATWQANEYLNVYANWAKGTRAPSVIELGCAFDKTPTFTGGDPDDPRNYLPKSLVENRQCTLPSTLSGDPYLKQIKATSYDMGARGTWGNLMGIEDIQWNLGAYQTDLKDDIYFINVGNAQGFFDNVGKTRRRGLEAGLAGKKGKLGMSVNYSLTDATFQDSFLMLSADNSSSFNLDGFGQVIQVEKGNRMPGVPLHNLNASLTYEVTDKWTVGLTAVAHSDSYVRGNENNQHQTGVTQYLRTTLPDPNNPGNSIVTLVPKQPTTNPGKVPGYATFNFQTSYKFNNEWTATMLVNNIFDKEYFSAGRLGRNPFSPSIFGAIGPDGYNHNSNDWRSTNFISPGAPRGAWISLNWHFAPNKTVGADMPMPTEPSELERKKN